ncbi:MAG: hypothetical protein Q8O64_02620 [Sideroxyarcus sp.]|nr:hypothetical protein [Sideroxyarcus sp.]
MLMLKSVVAWLLILVLAMLNGILREAMLLPNLSKPVAFFLSGLLLSFFIFIVAIALARWLEPGTPSRCIHVGLLWLSLTLIFEFGFGGMMQGKSWAEMLEAYTFKDGNIWPIVLMVTLFAPLVAARIRLRRQG